MAHIKMAEKERHSPHQDPSIVSERSADCETEELYLPSQMLFPELYLY